MPTASDELRNQMNEYFGDMDMEKPLQYLIENGWREKAGMLIKPEGREPDKKEWQCVDFLFEEWDFGYDPEMKV